MRAPMKVATTILAQLGGDKFMAMTGCKNFTGSAYALSFKLSQNKSGGTHMRITLTSMDSYLVEVLQCAKTGVKSVGYHENVYAENLQPLFKSITGLDTH